MKKKVFFTQCKRCVSINISCLYDFSDFFFTSIRRIQFTWVYTVNCSTVTKIRDDEFSRIIHNKISILCLPNTPSQRRTTFYFSFCLVHLLIFIYLFLYQQKLIQRAKNDFCYLIRRLSHTQRTDNNRHFWFTHFNKNVFKWRAE